jgi:hypothetical protein
LICSAGFLFTALCLEAAPRRHAVVGSEEVAISGFVRDAAGTPVAGVLVHSGTRFSSGTGTDGKYTLTLPANRPTLITAEYFAFEPATVTFTPTRGATLDITLSKPRPAVAVKLTNGETHVLDLATSTFAYYIPFSGYARFDNANFCKPDGSAFAPAKTEFARIVGPATAVNFSPCCSRGAVMTVNVEMKSGEKSQVYFNDSCFGGEVDFIGRERSTGQWQYYNFVNVAQIDFQ